MTKLPMEDRDVTGVEGGEYALNVLCAAPGCERYTRDPHHLWRRSALGGPFNWVSLGEEDWVIGNLVGLCAEHHHQVTVNACWINFDPDEREFWWCSVMSPPQPMEWQPPISDPVVVRNLRDSKAELEALEDVPPKLICPSCKRPLPHEKFKTPPEKRRPRRTWSITVPVDEREDGADVLDSLLDASREEMAKAGLPYGEESSVRYFVLTAALGLFVQHAEQVLS